MLRHLTLLLPTFLGATLLVFLAVRLLPGDVVDQILAASPDSTQATSDDARSWPATSSTARTPAATTMTRRMRWPYDRALTGMEALPASSTAWTVTE